jgi:hypothetical protein
VKWGYRFYGFGESNVVEAVLSSEARARTEKGRKGKERKRRVVKAREKI